MSKPALGRGLGQLLGKDAPSDPKAAPTSKTPGMTPGVAALFKVGEAKPHRESHEPSATAEPPDTAIHRKIHPPSHNPGLAGRRRLVKVSLIAADISIVGLVAWLLLGSSKPLTNLEILISVLAMVFGAWLTCLALFLD